LLDNGVRQVNNGFDCGEQEWSVLVGELVSVTHPEVVCPTVDDARLDLF
jgi:hypothetical protein